MKTFFQVLNEAVNELLTNGYTKERKDFWTRALKESIIHYLPTERQIKDKTNRHLTAVYDKSINKLSRVVGQRKEGTENEYYGAFTRNNMVGLERELESSIGKSLSLITNNRALMIQHMVNKFEGWASSVPVGKPPEKIGDKYVYNHGKKVWYRPGVDVKESIKKLARNEKYKVDRVLIDQTHKLVSNINDVFATKNGAIAAKWDITHTKTGVGGRPYEHRPEHVQRDKTIFLIKDSWADQQGLVKPVHGYTTDIEQPGELPFCRCSYVYIYNIKSLPEEFLTVKAKKMLQSKQ